MRDISEVRGLYARLKSANGDRDGRMSDVLAVRQGKMREVFPSLFPDDGPFDRGIVANMVDVAARDLAEVIAPLPSVNCSSTSMVSETQRKFAEKRTQIAAGYIANSRLQRQMFKAADRYVTFGFVPMLVEPDWDAKMPRVTVMDSMGAYPLFNQWGDVTAVFFRMMKSSDEVLAEYPEAEGYVNASGMSGSELLEVVRYHDKDQDLLMLPYAEGFLLRRAANKAGRCMAVWVERPSVDSDPHGQFDDVLAVQVAKARYALLSLEAATKAVQAPIAVPTDILEMSVGADAVLKSQAPEKIRRVSLDLSPATFAQQQVLDSELKQGSRYPEARQGQIDSSVVTGRGVQALMSGFDTQVRTAQAMFAIGITDVVEAMFAMDEALWPDEKKTIRGNSEGSPFEVTYTPAKDIKGDHTVDVQYGLMAGLEPNKALVFGLQARGDKLISRDFLRRQMPFALNATEEEQKVDAEETRDALKQAVFGYAQAIPILAQQGQDPGEILRRVAMIIEQRQKGTPIEQAILQAFQPEEPEPAPEAVEPMGMAEQMTPEGEPGAQMSDQPGIQGLDPLGRLRGVAPGQAGMGQGGRPDIQGLLAGLTQSGQANLQATVARRLPI